MSAELLASRRETTLILTLSNPGKKNTLHPDMYAAAIETLSTVERDDTICSVVITGAGNFFSAGSDHDYLMEKQFDEKSAQIKPNDSLHDWIESLKDCPKPVIAAIEGGAAGAGFSLALACDLIVATTSAEFVLPNVKERMTPDGGSLWFLVQALPRQLAMEILLEGKPISANRLHQIGLVNRLAVDGTALETALAWADELAAFSPDVLERIKTLMRDAQCITLAKHYEKEKSYFIK